jgi:hypothetical protein
MSVGHSISVAVSVVATVRTVMATNQQSIIKCLDSNVKDYAGRGAGCNKRNRHDDLLTEPSSDPAHVFAQREHTQNTAA